MTDEKKVQVLTLALEMIQLTLEKGKKNGTLTFVAPTVEFINYTLKVTK